MALVTQTFYSNTYYGETIATADFPKYETRAQDLILGLIKKTEAQALQLPAETLLLVQKAICAEMEYLLEYGINVSVYGKEAGGGFTVGKVSVQEGGGAAALSGSKSMIAPAVYVYLEQTGLLYPGVPTFGMPSQAWGWWP